MEIALLGNPNTGKTSLFNQLTGSYEYVGNWSGVTVEKKVGYLRNNEGKLIDLPGVYTLNPLSKDEAVVTEYFLNESCSSILNIVDASQLERNLHLTLQILESDKPISVGLNMNDVAENRGIKVDADILSKWLQCPVTPIIARNGSGISDLEVSLLNGQSTKRKQMIYYGQEIESLIEKGQELLGHIDGFSSRWIFLQLFEGNNSVRDYLIQKIGEEQTNHLLETASSIVMESEGMTLEDYIYEKRAAVIRRIIQEAVIMDSAIKTTITEKLDAIVTNKYLGMPIFLLLMYLMFMLTFDWLGSPLSDLLDSFISGPLTDWIQTGLTAVQATEFIQALILDGIVAGVGGVLVFIPQIFVLFFFISLLEDSGYMSRVAVVMDKIMEHVGLNGKAFIPMIISFGCNVPGIMAARTVETPKERLLTVLLSPLMSCSARLPVYAIFVGAFFTAHQGLVVMSMYLIGIIVALLLAKLFSSTILKGETSFFVIDLPPYRVPQAQGLLRSTWDKGKGFIRKAGTFIFAGSVIIWLLSYIGPGGLNVEMDKSFLAMIGSIFAPLLAPIGFGTWQAGASLITGFLAKEAVISTMNIIYYAPTETGLQGMLAQHFSPLSAFSFMVFILLYVPCLATVATIYKETNSRKWTLFSVGYALILAYIISLIVYQGGKLIGFA